MSQSSVGSEHEAILRHTIIANDEPGALLHDLQVMLDLANEGALQLTRRHLLSWKVLESLNEQMHRRIEHGLARPQQKSFPHINGLFLLLRASGLTTVDGSGRTPILVVDPTAGASWSELNPTERYFTLLESWLLP